MSLIKKSFYILSATSLVVVLFILAGENKPPEEKIAQEYKYGSFVEGKNSNE